MTKNLVALFAAVAATSALVSACGGGSSAAVIAPPPPAPAPTPVPPPAPGAVRGDIVGTGVADTVAKVTINNFGADGTKGPVEPGETASCNVTIRQLQYTTVAPSGALLTASAGLLVPSGTRCTGARPLLTMQHGTSDIYSFDGSSSTAQLPLTMMKYFAAHGYVVVIPDYLGYGASRNFIDYHPYVHAEANAATVIDAVRATRKWFATADGVASGVSLSSQLFLSGTSEGGYVTMATHRTMERDYAAEFTITADVPTSGPYDLSTEILDDLQFADSSGNSESGAAAFLLTSYQKIYGDLYTTPGDIFQAPWSGTVEGLFPGVYGSDTAAIHACKIPYNIDTSPGPQIGSCPSTNPLLMPAFVSQYLNDTPGTFGGVARAHVAANDLLQGWRNRAPMTPCYGSLDLTAQTNALAAGSFFGTGTVDVQTTGPSFITAWMQSTSVTNPDYHGQVEAPGCTAYARYSVFDTYVTPL